MQLHRTRVVGLVALAAFTQFACYNTYFISKAELEKLESSAEPQEIVTVYGDCPSGATISSLGPGILYAQADTAAPEASAEESTVASDAPIAAADPEADKAASTPPGCTKVDVSTGNALNIVLETGEKERVTPFNFIMNNDQLVSPEYNMLLSMNEVQGGEVSEFSTWKTVGTIVGVSAVAIGTFVGISLLAPDGEGFSAQ